MTATTTQAPPASRAPFPAAGLAPARPGVLAVVAGAVLCGFGLGAALLTLTAPPPETPGALSPPVRSPAPPPATAPPPAATADAAPHDRAAPRAWPAAFGTPPPPLLAEAPAAEAPAGPPPLPPLEARLRGLAMDENGGWALIEIEDRVALVRPGSALTPDHTIGTILTDAVMIETREGPLRLGFEDRAVNEPVAGRVRSVSRGIMSGRHDFDEMPLPLPPPSYVPGPGFSGPDHL